MNAEEPENSGSIAEKKNFVRNLLNILRFIELVHLVSLDNKLNEIAQAHSEDMRDYDYFGHINKAGEGPEERIKKFNYSGAIA